MKRLFKLIPLALVLCWSCSSEKEDVPNEVITSITIDPNQKAPVIESKGGTGSVSFNSTVAWVASVTNTRSNAWCTISPSSGGAGDAVVNIVAVENTTPDERNAIVTLRAGEIEKKITVVQKQKDALTVTSSKIEVVADGGEVSIEVKANVAFDYEIEEQGKQWITTSSTRGLTTSTLKFSVSKNESVAKREGSIVIRSGELTEKVTVYQSGAVASIVLTQNEYTIDSEGETIKVELKSNTDYEVQLPNEGWITEVVSRAFSSHTHYFTISKNETYDIREAEIIFINKENNVAEKVKIIQEQQNGIVVDQQLYNIDENGGVVEVNIASNIDCEVLIDSDWVKEVTSRSRSLSSHTHHFTISKNETYDIREAEISFINKENNVAEKVKIIQEQQNGIVVDQQLYNIDENGGVVEVNIASNIDCEVLIDSDWIREDIKTRGLTEKKLLFTIAAMSDGNRREGKITLTNKKATITETITIQQERRIYFENPVVKLLENKSLQLSYISIISDENVVWQSSDNNVATVTQDGVVVGVSKGTAIITIVTKDGKSKASCEVSVKPITDYISFSISSSIINIGGWIKKSVSSTIRNGSGYDITLISLTALHPVTNAVIAETSDVSLLGVLPTGEEKSLGVNNLNEDITPIFIWKYSFDGSIYSNLEKTGDY